MTFKNFKFRRTVLLLCSLSFFFLSHCIGGSGYNSVSFFPSVGEDTSLPDSSYFYFDLDENYYERLGVEVPFYEISTTEHYGDAQNRNSVSNCEIEHNFDDQDDLETSSSETKICILDIMEYDLTINNLKIIYNIPEGMCKYVRIKPPWHYNYKVGKGPSRIYACTPPSGTNDDEEEDDEEEEESAYCAFTSDTGVNELAVNGADYDCEGTTATDATDELRCSDEISNLCAYNYITDEEDISCCYGSYRFDGGLENWQSSEDSLKECIGGPGRTSWEHLGSNGLPKTLIEDVPKYGLKGSFDVQNVLDATGTLSHSTPVANYIKSLDEEPEDLRDTNRSSLPIFLKAPEGFYAPNPFFDVECVDSSGEVLHKLQLMVREWNTHEEFLEFYEDGGSEGPDPDVDGIEGDDCDYEERGTFKSDDQKCNDLLDFDDIEELDGDVFPGVSYGEGSSTE